MLTYDKGLDRYFGLTELAEKYNIFKKVATRYELPDGKKVYGKQINSNPAAYFTEDIMVQLEKAANEEFLYGDFQGILNDDRTDDTESSD